jgi:hypothetical protein
MTGDPIPAALHQLAGQREQITRLDAREADHHAALSARLTEIAGLVTGLGGIVNDHAAALAQLEKLDRHVGDLTARIAQSAPADENPDAYRPGLPPRWWKLTADQRQEPISRLRAWVDQVYRPGYGQLAASLGPCWEAHDLCLYGLDILSDLWSVLYLQPSRTAGMLSAQAEYQARILPALVEQMMTETSRCGHAQARRPVNGHARGRT